MTPPDPAAPVFRFEDFALDTGRGALLRGGEEVPLRRQSYDVLLHLVRNPGRLVTREELLQAVWGGTVVTDASITQCLVDIRAAIGDGQHEKIHTLPRRGYRFELAVERVEVSGAAADAEAREEGVARAAPRGGLRGARVGPYLVAALLIAAGALFWSAQREDDVAPGDDAPPATAADTRTVAVLPFVSLSGSEENEYFSDGLTEVMLHMLAQRPELKVTARTSAFAFKGRNEDIREIADALGVANVLEGSVQRDGDRVRITVQLIRARDGFHLWSRVFDRTVGDLFAIQDEIASDVATALDATLQSDRPPDGVATRSLAAYERYLQGVARQQNPTREHVLAADSLFREALALDPGFHDARTALARNNLLKEFVTLAMPNTQLAEARELLAAVLSDRPDDLVALQLASVVDVRIQLHEGGDLDARSDLLQAAVDAVERGFGDPLARNYVAGTLLGRGRNEEAMAIVQQGLSVDPLNPDLLGTLGSLYRLTGREVEARTPLLTAHRLEPENAAYPLELSHLEADLGDPVAQLDWLRRAMEIDPSQPGMPFEVAILLYELKLPELARPWHEHVESIDNFPYRGEWLDMLALKADGDFEALAAVAGVILGRHLEEGTNIDGMYGLTRMYTESMHRLGRSREAAAFLGAQVPGLYDLTEFDPDSEISQVQLGSTPILKDVLEPRVFQEALRARVAAFDADPRWQLELRRPLVLLHLVLGGKLSVAKDMVMNEYAAYPPLHHYWTEILEDPWLAPLRADFELAQRLEEIVRERSVQRREIIEHLADPAWDAP